jgi:hypothetical protein
LIPAEDFGPLTWLTDAELAELFAVPVEQVGARRHDLAAGSPGAGRPH